MAHIDLVISRTTARNRLWNYDNGLIAVYAIFYELRRGSWLYRLYLRIPAYSYPGTVGEPRPRTSNKRGRWICSGGTACNCILFTLGNVTPVNAVLQQCAPIQTWPPAPNSQNPVPIKTLGNKSCRVEFVNSTNSLSPFEISFMTWWMTVT